MPSVQPTSDKTGRYFYVGSIYKGESTEICKAKVAGACGFEKLVAIKRLLPENRDDELLRGRLVREAVACSRLCHHNIVGVYDFYHDEHGHNLAMELVEGTSLATILTYQRRLNMPFPFAATLTLIRQLLDALEYIHHARDPMSHRLLGIVHRDIRPRNILIDHRNVLKLIDFGRCQALPDTDDVLRDARAITPYSPPELRSGISSGPATDLFSCAAVLFEMITLQKLIASASGETEDRHYLEIAKKIETLSDDLAPLIPIFRRALALDPELRYTSAADMARDLSTLDLQFPIGGLQIESVVREVVESAELLTPNEETVFAFNDSLLEITDELPVERMEPDDTYSGPVYSRTLDPISPVYTLDVPYSSMNENSEPASDQRASTGRYDSGENLDAKVIVVGTHPGQYLDSDLDEADLEEADLEDDEDELLLDDDEWSEAGADATRCSQTRTLNLATAPWARSADHGNTLSKTEPNGQMAGVGPVNAEAIPVYSVVGGSPKIAVAAPYLISVQPSTGELEDSELEHVLLLPAPDDLLIDEDARTFVIEDDHADTLASATALIPFEADAGRMITIEDDSTGEFALPQQWTSDDLLLQPSEIPETAVGDGESEDESPPDGAPAVHLWEEEDGGLTTQAVVSLFGNRSNVGSDIQPVQPDNGREALDSNVQTLFLEPEPSRAPTVSLPEDPTLVSAVSSWVLVFLNPNPGQARVLPQTGLTLGRAHANDIVVADLTVAPRHAVIVWEAGQWWIRAQRGEMIRVNRQDVSESVLQSGILIEIGKARLTVARTDEDAPRGMVDYGALEAELVQQFPHVAMNGLFRSSAGLFVTEEQLGASPQIFWNETLQRLRDSPDPRPVRRLLDALMDLQPNAQQVKRARECLLALEKWM